MASNRLVSLLSILIFTFLSPELRAADAPESRALICIQKILTELEKNHAHILRIHEGQPKDPYLLDLLYRLGHTPHPESKNVEAFELGDGTAGVVYRIVEYREDNTVLQTTVLKKYEAQNASEAKNDSEAMIRMAAYYQEIPKAVENFKIAIYSLPRRTYPGFVITVSNTRGRSLESIQLDHDISPKLKHRIAELYQIRANKWVEVLKAKGFKRSRHGSVRVGVYAMIPPKDVLKGNGNDSYMLIIHPGQVIVDLDNLEMTIIDPS